MTTENNTVTILARYNFSDAEVRQIALKMAASASEYSSTEAEFASVKLDFKSKLERLELDRDTLTQKIRDGFEMRNTPAQVMFNTPSAGRKSYFHMPHMDRGQIISYGDFIREEAMDATDFQRDLPLRGFTGEAIEGPEVCEHGVPTGERCESCDILTETAREIGREIIDPERFPETGDSAKEIAEARAIVIDAGENIGTSIAEKLAEAAQGAAPNPVVIDFGPKDDGNKCLAKWRKAARNQGWPEPCIDLIDGIAKDAGTGKQAVLSVLHAHSLSTEDLASTFGTSQEK